jgi:hypothetical protein
MQVVHHRANGRIGPKVIFTKAVMMASRQRALPISNETSTS